MDIVINIRELDDVLLKDVGNRIEQSGRYVTLDIYIISIIICLLDACKTIIL